MDLELNGKVAIVTGGSRGIGKSIAEELALAGCDVAICARNSEGLAKSSKELGHRTGKNIIGIVADMGKPRDVDRMVSEAADALGHIDILVNNAATPGSKARGSLADIDLDDLIDDLNTKVVGYFRCAQVVAPYMRAHGWGRIINICGMSARQPREALGASIRNSGIVNMTKYLADQLGHYGVTVNAVYPGTTRTERTAGEFQEMAIQQGTTVEQLERRIASGNSTNRIVDATEGAYVVAFLASPRAIAISGEAIAVSGGTGGAMFH